MEHTLLIPAYYPKKMLDFPPGGARTFDDVRLALVGLYPLCCGLGSLPGVEFTGVFCSRRGAGISSVFVG